MNRVYQLRAIPLFLLLVPVLFTSGAPKASPQSHVGDATMLHLDELMSSAQFKACGLNKLSPQELQHLDSWLNSYTGRVASLVSKKQPAKTPGVIESQIDGDFEGWSGETIFKLMNGQIWQQDEYDYMYEYSYMPNVTIYKTSGCYKMKVEDVEDEICVKRIK